MFPGDGRFIHAEAGGFIVRAGLGLEGGGRRLGWLVFEFHRVHAPVGREPAEQFRRFGQGTQKKDSGEAQQQSGQDQAAEGNTGFVRAGGP